MCGKSSRVLQCSPSPEFKKRNNCSKCKSDHRFTLDYIVGVLSLSMKAKCENNMKKDLFFAQTGSGDSTSERVVRSRKAGHRTHAELRGAPPGHWTMQRWAGSREASPLPSSKYSGIV